MILSVTVSTILDTGSTFTLIPHTIWKKLKLNPNLLDTSTTYNIKSASHTNFNAVLGSLTLAIEMKTTSCDTLIANQKCLVLRPELNLGILLLGTDFMTANGAGVQFYKFDSSIIVHVQG